MEFNFKINTKQMNIQEKKDSFERVCSITNNHGAISGYLYFDPKNNRLLHDYPKKITIEEKNKSFWKTHEEIRY